MKITRAGVVIIFLALIRTITAYYQLKTRPGNLLPAGQVEPIITGSLVAALFCLALTLLSFPAGTLGLGCGSGRTPVPRCGGCGGSAASGGQDVHGRR